MSIVRSPWFPRKVRFVAAAALSLPLMLSVARPAAAASYPTSHTITLPFLQDPGQPPDPDVYYAGEGLLLTRNMYQGLVQYQPGTAQRKIIPELATSWTISKNGLVYTFQLRHGVLFHDGTPFTSAAIAPDFARRAAVDGGPAYMVSDVASVATPSTYTAVITLKTPNAAFMDYLASAYGPVMESPTALAAHAGNNDAQTYLETHDIGTGPYTLTEAKVGVMYQMKYFPQYWGPKPYYTTVDMPVIDNLSSEEIEFNDGKVDAMLHDVTTTGIARYRHSSSAKVYTLPTLESETAYVNENKGFLVDRSNRLALLEAIDIRAIDADVFPGRATVPTQAGPAHLMPAQYAKQNIPYDPGVLKKVVAKLPASERSLTVGYDTGAPDDQLIAELVGAELQAEGLNTKVVGYQTSSIFGWVGSLSSAKSASTPNLLIDYFWPDADNPYTWTHISYDPSGGLQYLTCNVPGVEQLNNEGVLTGSDARYSEAAEKAVASGCWLNIADKDDTMVVQPWLRGVAQAHVVAAPEMLLVADLYPGASKSPHASA